MQGRRVGEYGPWTSGELTCLFRELANGILWDPALKGEVVQKSWQVFKGHPLSRQTVYPDTPVGRLIKGQAWVNREIITKLHYEKDVNGRWRHGQVIRDNIETLPRCGGMVLGKPKLD